MVILALAIGWKSFKESLSGVSKPALLASSLLFAVLVAPLIRAIVLTPSLLKPALAIPEHLPSIFTVIKSFGWNVLALGWKTPYHTDWLLGRLPILDIIEITLIIFGIYAMYTLAKQKAKLIFAALLIGLFIEAINQNINMTLLILPPLFVLMTAGLRYLYFEWRSVFPHNPIPKVVALGFISLIAITHLVYGVRYTIEAWPSSKATQAAYSGIITR
jgi:hypothetical protein